MVHSSGQDRIHADESSLGDDRHATGNGIEQKMRTSKQRGGKERIQKTKRPTDKTMDDVGEQWWKEEYNGLQRN